MMICVRVLDLWAEQLFQMEGQQEGHLLDGGFGGFGVFLVSGVMYLYYGASHLNGRRCGAVVGGSAVCQGADEGGPE